MACNTCKQKNLSEIYFQMAAPKFYGDCDVTQEQVAAIKERLICLKPKIKYVDYNRAMGIVISLLNTQNYCKYNLQPLITLLDEFDC